VFEFPDPSDPQGPMQLLKRLQGTHEELFEVRDLKPKLAILFRTDEVIRQGTVRLGTCYLPSVQGELRPLFDQLLLHWLGMEELDFLIVLSKPFWDAANDLEREALLVHEAMHMAQAVDRYGTPRFNLQSGDPIWAIRPHDLEEFDAIVKRYGRWKPDVGRFLDAAAAGAVGRGGGA
jgi:hypothetical protein